VTINDDDVFQMYQNDMNKSELKLKNIYSFENYGKLDFLDVKEVTYSDYRSISATLAGDGFINKRTGVYSYAQAKVHTFYFRHISRIFINIISTSAIYDSMAANGNTENNWLPLKTTEFIHEIYNKWYSINAKNEKQIPTDFMITPTVLAMWICDDGSLISENKIEVAICCFNKESQNRLIKKFDQIGFHASIDCKSRHYPVLIIDKSTNTSYINLVKENMPDSMLYKLDLEFKRHSFDHLNSVNPSELLINNSTFRSYFKISKNIHCCRICGKLVVAGDSHYNTHLHSSECHKCGIFFSSGSTTSLKGH